MEESKNYIVKGAKVKWAKVHEPDGTFPPARWSINIFPTDEQAKELQAMGIVLHPDEKGDGSLFFTAKRNVETNAGKKLSAPRVVGPDKAPFTDAIGNGSVCNVIVNVYPWTFGKKKGIGAWLEAVQVVEHVPYERRDGVDFEAVDQPAASGGNDGMPF